MFANFSINITRRWLIIFGLIVITCLLGLVYTYNQFYRQDRVDLEVLQGVVTKTRASIKQIIPSKGENILPGDTFEVSKNGSVALIFHDGSILTFTSGDMVKYDYFNTKDQHNHFNFINQTQNNTFEYVTQAFLSKAGAVILGRETGMENLTRSKVLGANDKKLSDSEKIKLWSDLNTCIQQGDTKQTYNEILQKCMSSQNLLNLDQLSN